MTADSRQRTADGGRQTADGSQQVSILSDKNHFDSSLTLAIPEKS
jgi:hypothetical protein